MKKRILAIVALLCVIPFSIHSQNNSESIRSNEIGIDLLDLALFRAIDLTYEYVKKPEIGLGITGRYCFDSKENILNGERYGITPFFRYYFFNKRDYGSKGFYVESFLKCFGGEMEGWYNHDNYTYESFFEIAFGVGLGFKYVSRSGFVLDLNLGGGRSFGISEYSPEMTGRCSILMGYRF